MEQRNEISGIWEADKEQRQLRQKVLKNGGGTAFCNIGASKLGHFPNEIGTLSR